MHKKRAHEVLKPSFSPCKSNTLDPQSQEIEVNAQSIRSKHAQLED